jgi:hypothetical protein
MVLLLAMLLVISSAGTAFAQSVYYKVSGHSMHPELKDGDTDTSLSPIRRLTILVPSFFKATTISPS